MRYEEFILLLRKTRDMTEKQPQYIEGTGWRYELEHSMHRRMTEHDYRSRSIYMITMSVEGRRPLLGELRWSASDASDAHVVPTALGREVERCWMSIHDYYPEAEPLKVQLMPDHIHAILFVKRDMADHLGKIINGFKIGCNKAYRQLFPASAPCPESVPCPVLCPESVPLPESVPCPEALPLETKPETKLEATPAKRPKHPKHGMLFETGYQDSVLKGKGQLEHMFQYLADNPRRLAIKRLMPDLFRVVSNITIAGRTFAAIGNRWLLDRPVKMQVRCHNNTTPTNLRLIENQKRYFLERGGQGGVVVSPCISAGEKEIARAALDAKNPLIVILENGFPPMYKPPGKYFEACAEGLLLMLAPWPYHMEKRKISRQQCLELNEMAKSISTEPWTQELEKALLSLPHTPI